MLSVLNNFKTKQILNNNHWIQQLTLVEIKTQRIILLTIHNNFFNNNSLMKI